MSHDDLGNFPQLLTESQAATLLHQSLSTLRRWRRQGNGPAFVRFGRLIFYQPQDLEEFVDAHRCNREGK